MKFLLSQIYPNATLLFLICVIVAGFSGCVGPTNAPPKECTKWYCERTGMTLQVDNGLAHFVDKDGGVVAIRTLRTAQTDKVWEAKTGDKLVISKVSDTELYVGTEDSNNDKVAGIYTPLSDSDQYVLPIDLDGRNHIDINVEVVPGEKPKVTVKDKLASTEDSDE